MPQMSPRMRWRYRILDVSDNAKAIFMKLRLGQSRCSCLPLSNWTHGMEGSTPCRPALRLGGHRGCMTARAKWQWMQWPASPRLNRQAPAYLDKPNIADPDDSGVVLTSLLMPFILIGIPSLLSSILISVTLAPGDLKLKKKKGRISWFLSWWINLIYITTKPH